MYRFVQAEHEEMNIFVLYSLFHTCIIHSPFPKAEPCLLMKLYTEEQLFQPKTVFMLRASALLFTKNRAVLYVFPFFSLTSLVCQRVYSATKLYKKPYFRKELNYKWVCCTEYAVCTERVCVCGSP